VNKFKVFVSPVKQFLYTANLCLLLLSVLMCYRNGNFYRIVHWEEFKRKWKWTLL